MWYKIRQNNCYAAMFLCLFFPLVPILAQGEIKFSADKIEMSPPEKNSVFYLSGNAMIGSSDFQIKAENISVFGRDSSKIEAKSDVILDDYKFNISATSFILDYYRDIGKLKMSGNVEVKNSKDNFIIRSGTMEIAKKDAPIIFRVAVRIFQDNLFARADLAIYNRELNELQLIGNTYISQEGEVYHTDRSTINMKTKEISLEGGISGNMSDKRLQLE